MVGGLRLATRDVAPPYWPPLSLAPPPQHPPPMGMLPGPMAEESDCFMLGEKLLKKPKRIRTRVDAGEPRNPYSGLSSLPNLCGVSVRPGSSGPNIFSGTNQAYCGLPFINYFTPPQVASARGMLSELFAGHNRPILPSCPPEDRVSTMGVLDKVTSSNVHNTDALNSVIRGPEPENVLLREILQGRKRELLAMEDLESNRSLHNNNNSYKNSSSELNNDENSVDETVPRQRVQLPTNSSVSDEDERCESEVEETLSQSPRPDTPNSDNDPKKNRLENIVSVIRSSPTPSTTPVNGCKKRKLYLPQQHEARQQDSPGDEPESPHEPDNKSRRTEADESSESRQDTTDEGGLQIDLTVRSEERSRRSPDVTRTSSPKLPTSASGSENTEPPNYLLDYAKQLLRNQREQQDLNLIKSNEMTDSLEKLHILRTLTMNNSHVNNDLEGLADVLKTEISASITVIIDSIVNKYINQRKMFLNKHTEAAVAAAEQLHRDIASHLMERSRSPRSNKGLERHPPPGPRMNGVPPPHAPLNLTPYHQVENNLGGLGLPHLRPPLYKTPHAFFQGSLPPTSGIVPLGQTSPYAAAPPEPEQEEAMSLVVTPKKKRHKVTDSRLTPRTVGRLLEDIPRYPHVPVSVSSGNTSPRSSPPPPPLPPTQPPPRPAAFPQPPPPLLPVSLPTSVAIPNPSLQDTSLLYPSYYGRGASSPIDNRREESPAHPPPPHHPLLHPALLAASPDSFSHFLRGAEHDRASDCSPADNHYDGIQPHSMSFYPNHERKSINICACIKKNKQ